MHEYLGRLQCEAGRAKRGIKHLRLALELDPTLSTAWVDIARVRALQGRWEESDAAMKRLAESLPGDNPAFVQQRIRLASWRGDVEPLRPLLDRLQGTGQLLSLIRFHAQVVLGEVDPDEANESLRGIGESIPNLRLSSLVHQLAAETSGFHGRTAPAYEHVQAAAEGRLVDLEWMDLCPVLEDVRRAPGFTDLRERVRQRAEAIWSL